jgi:hypothetical protein
LKSRTSAPTSVITPATSWPSTKGGLYLISCLNSPLRVILSGGLMLAALTLTRTSRLPTLGSGTSTARGPSVPYCWTTNAFMVAVLSGR